MTQIAERRRALLWRLAELDNRLHGIVAELEATPPKDWEELALEREDDEVLEGLGQAGQDEIRRIRAALQRIRDDEYGFCARCGEEILPERLDLLPDTPFCKQCAAAVG